MRATQHRSTSPFAAAVAGAVLLAVAACGSSDSEREIVTESVRHQDVDSTVVGGELEVSAVDYVRALDAELELGLSANDDYDVTSVVATPGLRHVRLQQTHAGVPVVGAELVVHADDTTFLGLNGRVTRHLDGFDVTPSVSQEQAFATAKAHLAGDVTGIEYSRESATLVIRPRDGGVGADLAWQLEFFSTRAGPVEPGRWSYFVDARENTVLHAHNGLTTLEQASGPGGNAKFSRTWDAELDVEPADDGEYEMKTDRLETRDAAMDDEVVTGPLEMMEDRNANDAHGYAEITLDMMRDWMGRDSIDDGGMVIVSVANGPDVCGMGPSNACWNGSEVAYGVGGGDYHAWSGALDIVAHEINHGFTEFHSDLAYFGDSGALNESFSDIAGVIAEFYERGSNGDFEIGEDIRAGSGALRYMCDPTADGYSIDHTRDYYAGHEVHSSSGIPNRAFCLAVGRFKASTSGGNTLTSVRQVGHIWYAANAAYWTSATDFEEACRGTIDAARALGYDAEVVEGLAQSWADVGVECDSAAFVCDADGYCDVGEGETCASCAEDCGACSEDCSFWKKSKCKIGIGDCSACDAPAGCGDGLCNGDETDESCGQDCGCQALSCELLAPFGCYCDPTCEEFGDCCADYGSCN